MTLHNTTPFTQKSSVLLVLSARNLVSLGPFSAFPPQSKVQGKLCEANPRRSLTIFCPPVRAAAVMFFLFFLVVLLGHPELFLIQCSSSLASCLDIFVNFYFSGCCWILSLAYVLSKRLPILECSPSRAGTSRVRKTTLELSSYTQTVVSSRVPGKFLLWKTGLRCQVHAKKLRTSGVQRVIVFSGICLTFYFNRTCQSALVLKTTACRLKSGMINTNAI